MEAFFKVVDESLLQAGVRDAAQNWYAVPGVEPPGVEGRELGR
jgi:hypothetical protein